MCIQSVSGCLLCDEGAQKTKKTWRYSDEFEMEEKEIRTF